MYQTYVKRCFKSGAMDFDDLTLEAAYYQVDTIRGFRYLDMAGVVMNRWDDEFPKKSVSTNGLDLSGGSGPIVRATVSNTKIWTHVRRPSSPGNALEIASDFCDAVGSILGVTRYKRAGLRLQYAKDIEHREVAVRRASESLLSPQFNAVADDRSVVDGVRVQKDLVMGTVRMHLIVGIEQRSDAAKDISEDKQDEGDEERKSTLVVDADIYIQEDSDVPRARSSLKRGLRWFDGLTPAILESLEFMNADS